MSAPAPVPLMENEVMTRRSRMVALAAGSAMIALQTAPLRAEGVTAGTTITNTATVDFRVGGLDQTEVLASDSFTVDRKINLVAVGVPAATITVSPGQTRAVSVFDILNSSNAPLDLGLQVTQSSGGAGPYGGTDSFDATNVEIYRDVNDDGALDAGDQLITYLDEVPADATLRVLVVADIPLAGRVNNDVAAFTLTAEAREAGGAGSLGAAVTQTSGANTSGVDTVFVDGAGAGDGSRDARFGVAGSYTVFAASLVVTKVSRLISDPVNGTTNPKAIPDAVVEYCIAVSNGASSATATNVVVTDTVPGDLAFDTTFGIRVNGTVNGSGECLADGTAGGSFAGNPVTITAPLPDVAANQTRTVYFRATIQ